MQQAISLMYMLLKGENILHKITPFFYVDSDKYPQVIIFILF